MAAVYNEFEPYPAQWLRNLIKKGLLADGEVDGRSIVDVGADDYRGFTQVHLFAGLGGWGYAARLAGWPDDRPLFTGSCPCQPYSVAGRGKGRADDRDLWPEMFRLIAGIRPDTVMGEQVSAAIGKNWLDRVYSDLERIGYASGALVIPACAVDAPHIRNRLWFVADSVGSTCQRDPRSVFATETGKRSAGQFNGNLPDRPKPSGHIHVADHDSIGPQEPFGQSGDAGSQFAPAPGSDFRDVVNLAGHGWGEGWTEHEFRSRGLTAAVASVGGRQFLECPDGKWRRLPPPRVRWLGHGIPARVAKLRALGNAIVPQVAAEIMKAWMDCRP